MFNENCWRQPMPTDILTNECIDVLSRLLFFEILALCRNKPYHTIYHHGDRKIHLELKRGQCLFVVSKYAKSLKIERRVVQKSLEIISKWYTELHIERKPYGLIITVLQFDSITKMHNETNIRCTTSAQRVHIESTSKNKTVKKEEERTDTQNAREGVDKLKNKSYPDYVFKIFDEYPRLDGNIKAAAEYITNQNFDNETVDQIIASIKTSKASELWNKQGGRFIPFPLKYFEEERWRGSAKVHSKSKKHDKISEYEQAFC